LVLPRAILTGRAGRIQNSGLAQASEAVARVDPSSPHNGRYIRPYTAITALWASDGSSKGDDKNFDPYKILGISRKATKQEVKAAFRKIVSANHPDKFPDDPTKRAEAEVNMERINRAYYILGDEERRARYDRFGEEGVGTSAAGDEQLQQMGGDANMFFSNFDDPTGFGEGGMVDLSDLLSEMFGGAIFGGANAGSRGRGNNKQAAEQRQKVNGD
jgi:DnaJ-class molecular chaperone